jgi:hypothetical protein
MDEINLEWLINSPRQASCHGRFGAIVCFPSNQEFIGLTGMIAGIST